MKPKTQIKKFLSEGKGGDYTVDTDGYDFVVEPNPNCYYATLPSREHGYKFHPGSESKSIADMCRWLGTDQARVDLESHVKSEPGRGNIREVNPFLVYRIRKTDENGEFTNQVWEPKQACAVKQK